MRVNRCIACEGFPCVDVRHDGYGIPAVSLRPEKITIVMVSEAAPPNPADGYYAAGDPLFQATTVQAFNDAGVAAASIRDILGLGVYLTTAVKCTKVNYGLQASTIEQCSRLLERELALFPNTKVLLLMGDVAIQSLNAIARRAGEKRIIPAQPTYKLRGQAFFYHGWRVFPSYLQAGPSFFIEKSKRRMIAEDIASALRFGSAAA